MTEETTKYGHKYLSHSALTYGDYGGAGSVGVSNVRVILDDEDNADRTCRMTYRAWENLDKWNDDFTEQAYIDDFNCPEPPLVVHLQGGYGSNTLWLLDCEEMREVIASLEDYPLLDDCDHSEVEVEWEEDAWDDWIRYDLHRTLSEELQDKADSLPDEKLFSAYRKAMEACNEYPVAEHAGVYVNVGHISDTYAEYIDAY